MAKNENVSRIDRKGKPSGNGHESEGLQNAFAGTTPELEKKISDDFLDDVTGEPGENVDIKHHNRHLHKGEEVKTFKDREE